MPTPEQMSRLNIRDLAKLSPEEQRAMLQSANEGLRRGVDLAHLKAKREHEHKWVIVAQFELDDAVIAKMSERRLIVANTIAKGEDLVDDGGQVAMPMGEQNIIWSEGPGCVKCGAHWEHPDLGHGFKCAVADEDWQQQRQMQANAIAQQSHQMLGQLVARQQAAMQKAGN